LAALPRTAKPRVNAVSRRMRKRVFTI
jgi:hypothetical protein